MKKRPTFRTSLSTLQTRADVRGRHLEALERCVDDRARYYRRHPSPSTHRMVKQAVIDLLRAIQ